MGNNSHIFINDSSQICDDDLVLHDNSSIPSAFKSRSRRNKSMMYTAADILQQGISDLDYDQIAIVDKFGD